MFNIELVDTVGDKAEWRGYTSFYYYLYGSARSVKTFKNSYFKIKGVACAHAKGDAPVHFLVEENRVEFRVALQCGPCRWKQKT